MKFLFLISAALALSDRRIGRSEHPLLSSDPGYIIHKYENAKVYFTDSDTYLATSCKQVSNLINSQGNLLSSSWDNAGTFNVYVKSKDYIFIEHIDEKTNAKKYVCPNSDYTQLSLCQEEFGFVSGNKKDQDYFIGSNEFGISLNTNNLPSCSDNSKSIAIKRGLNSNNISIRIIGKDTRN